MALKGCNYRTASCVALLSLICCVTHSNGQAINPMMYGMGQYMNPYYTGFYGGFGNMGNLNPLGYQLSSGMAIPGAGAGGGGGYGGGGGQYFGAASTSTPSIIVITAVTAAILALRLHH
ncbi:hypothetical protein BV898_01737 [Hypsibius exemplaris]|uniref:Uncharacterized protein n=1 Tax=Hypsibius exemplaris TaxID=2072580 RepID=A0A1W0XB94_HYPEX|nr:hypothetical protein BV898_01737 [Hypsibius exemplaris]